MSGARKLACIIGWPVNRSLSPAIHNAAFAELGLDWTYVPLAVRPGAIEEGMRLFRLLGVEGANVTMPHKQSIVPFLDGVEGDAAVVEAVNTVVRRGGRLIGRNTDGEGFLTFLRADAGWDPAGRRALVLGAGGAARAVAVALAGAGASVRVAARRPDQAAEVVALAEKTGSAGEEAIAEGEAAPGRAAAGKIETVEWGRKVRADLVVNATPAREGLPLEAFGFRKGMLAVDLIYPPPPTPFVEAARAAGATAFDGLLMLVRQAALSFELWTGREAPVEGMERAAREALAAES